MFNSPKTLEEAKKLTYGKKWGIKRIKHYDDKYCAYAVSEGRRTHTWWQCSRKPGHGVAGLYCRQHAKLVKE